MPKTVMIEADRWERILGVIDAAVRYKVYIEADEDDRYADIYIANIVEAADYLHPTDADPIEADPEPSKPFDLLTAVLTEQGHSHTALPKRELSRQLAAAKRLADDGVDADEVIAITRWVRGMGITGIDMYTVEKFLPKYRLRAETPKRPDKDDWRRPGQGLVTV